MLIYAVMISAIVLVWLPALAKGANSKFALVASFFILFIVMALRGSDVGTDTSTYINLFKSSAFYSLSSASEIISSAPLYSFYSKVLYDLFPFSQAILLFNSAIICFGFGFFISQCTKNHFLATILFVLSYSFFFSMNGMRQSVAGALVLIAVVFVLKKRWLLVVLFAVCGIMIHSTVIVCIVGLTLGYLVFMKSKKPSSFMTIILVTSIAVLVLYEPLVTTFVNLFPRYQMYAEPGSAFSYTDRNQGRQSLVYILYLFILWIAISNKEVKETLAKSERLSVLFPGAIIAVGLGLFCSNFELFARILYYFLPFLCCFIADGVQILDKETRTVGYSLGTLLAFGMVCIFMLSSNYGDVVPYSFFFTS